MEHKIIEQLKTAKRLKQVEYAPDELSNRDIQRLNQIDKPGSGMDTLTDFHTTDLERILIEDGLVTEIVRLIGQGKEANVYWIRDDSDRDMALKLFRMNTSSHRDAFSKVGDTGKLQVAENFALREYLNLSYAEDAGMNVPRGGVHEEFIFTMDFLGDEQGPAPLLRNVDLQEEGADPVTVLEEVLDQVDLMFNSAQLVHGDFSEHNLVWYRDTIWVIDFLQSERWHPHFDTDKRIKKTTAVKTLRKDVDHILTYFRRTYRKSFPLEQIIDILVPQGAEDLADLDMMNAGYNPNWVNTRGR